MKMGFEADFQWQERLIERLLELLSQIRRVLRSCAQELKTEKPRKLLRSRAWGTKMMTNHRKSGQKPRKSAKIIEFRSSFDDVEGLEVSWDSDLQGVFKAC